MCAWRGRTRRGKGKDAKGEKLSHYMTIASYTYTQARPRCNGDGYSVMLDDQSACQI